MGFVGEESNIIKQLRPADSGYDREVTRKDNVFVIDANGVRHLYTATKVACPNCATANKKHPNPYCYQSQCKKCKFFGQKIDVCRQTTLNNQ